MIDKKILKQILDSREARSDKQRELISKYNKSLISFTLNIPGKVKDSPNYRNIHREGMKAILNKLEEKAIPIIYKESFNKITGSEGYIVADLNPIDLKKITVEIEENHFLGRIFDIDVFDSYHNQISRSDLKTSPRKCLLCNNDARVCMRMKTHTYEELINKIYETWEKYKNKETLAK